MSDAAKTFNLPESLGEKIDRLVNVSRSCYEETQSIQALFRNYETRLLKLEADNNRTQERLDALEQKGKP
jgi:hypothetical protein